VTVLVPARLHAAYGDLITRKQSSTLPVGGTRPRHTVAPLPSQQRQLPTDVHVLASLPLVGGRSADMALKQTQPFNLHSRNLPSARRDDVAGLAEGIWRRARPHNLPMSAQRGLQGPITTPAPAPFQGQIFAHAFLLAFLLIARLPSTTLPVAIKRISLCSQLQECDGRTHAPSFPVARVFA